MILFRRRRKEEEKKKKKRRRKIIKIKISLSSSSCGGGERDRKNVFIECCDYIWLEGVSLSFHRVASHANEMKSEKI